MGGPVTPAYHVKNMQLRNAQLSDNRLRSLRVLSAVLLQCIASTKYIAPAQTEEDAKVTDGFFARSAPRTRVEPNVHTPPRQGTCCWLPQGNRRYMFESPRQGTCCWLFNFDLLW